MALISFTTNNYFLKRVSTDYFSLFKKFFDNLKKFLIWFTLPLLIIAFPFYILFLLFYAMFLVCSFAQDFDNIPSKCKWLILTLKFILYLPSTIIIAIVYYPAFILGGIITLITFPCEKLLKKINN